MQAWQPEFESLNLCKGAKREPPTFYKLFFDLHMCSVATCGLPTTIIIEFIVVVLKALLRLCCFCGFLFVLPLWEGVLGGSHLGKPKAEPGLQMAEGGESEMTSLGFCLGVCPEDTRLSPCFPASDFFGCLVTGSGKEGVCCFVVFQTSALECIVSIPHLHSPFGPPTFSSPVNVRVRIDVPSGPPWISWLVTKPLVQTRLAWLCLLLCPALVLAPQPFCQGKSFHLYC